MVLSENLHVLTECQSRTGPFYLAMTTFGIHIYKISRDQRRK